MLRAHLGAALPEYSPNKCSQNFRLMYAVGGAWKWVVHTAMHAGYHMTLTLAVSLCIAIDRPDEAFPATTVSSIS